MLSSHKKKNLIVLINPFNPDPPPNYFGPPYGLSLIGAILLKNKRPVKAYDFDQDRFPIEEIINKDKPRYIGITIQSATRGIVYKMIKEIKKIDKTIKIILGGPFASQYYKLLLNNFPIDYIVVGDGEVTLNELLEYLDNKKNIREVKGIAFMTKKKIIFTGGRESIKDLDLLPYPAFHLFKDFDKKINSFKENPEFNFILGKRCTSLKNALMLLSSRGCIYSCNFCPMSKIFKNKIRFHSPKYFLTMIEYFYRKYKIRDYIFGDNFFTLDKNRTKEICKEIIKRRLNIRWGCMTRPDSVDFGLLKLMAQAGCFEISYGVESGSLKIQKTTRKGLNLTLTKKVFNWTEKLGIRAVLMLMVGNLGENKTTIKETLAYIKDIECSNILVNITKVYPGTKIHDLFEEKGLINSQYYLSSGFNPPSFTLEHSEEDLNKFKQMIKTRRTLVEINNKCNNYCTFCRLNRRTKNKTFTQIKKELILASRRGEYVILGGGEPLLRKDFFKILNFAQDIPIHKIYLHTNGRLFFYRSLAEEIGKTKLQRLIIPFFGLEKLHDKTTNVKGSFFQSVEGIKNLKKFAPNLKIQANIYVSSVNINSLLNLVRFLTYLNLDEFRFIFLSDLYNLIKINPFYLPSVSSVISSLKQISTFLKDNKINYYIVGIPFCILPLSLRDKPCEPFYPFNEKIILKSKLINCRKEREKQKIKFGFCKKCQENALCEGIWKQYYKIYGNKKFKSL